jgi:hypothetical protein
MKTVLRTLPATLALLVFGCDHRFERSGQHGAPPIEQETRRQSAHSQPSGENAVAMVPSAGETSISPPSASRRSERGEPKAVEPFEVRYQESRFLRVPDMFLATDSPPMVSAHEATFLREDDEVFGVVVSGQARAYPVRALCYHHVINDHIEDTPVVVMYCVICSSGMSFDPVVNDQQLTFGFHGIWQGVAVVYDRQTRSVWLHLTGECIEGPFKGTTLKAIAGRHVLWSEWKRDHPNTQVMGEEQRFKSRYFPTESARRGLDYFPRGFRSTIQTTSELLSPSALCYGIKTPAAAKAYPFDALAHLEDGLLNDRVGDVPVVVVFEKGTRSAVGHGRTLDGKLLEFERTPEGLLRDKKTGSVFDRDGYGVSGPLKGDRLPSVVGVQAEWYGWFASYPDTSVYGVEPNEM